jgi:hypothetical protein
MNRLSMIALVLGLLLAFAAQAQDPKKPAAGAAAQQAPAPGPGQEVDPKIIEGIMACLGQGLPEGWKKAWFVISEIGREADGSTRQYEGNFFYATDPDDRKGTPFKPCGANRVVDGVLALNAYLQPSQRRWTGVTMTFLIDGRYEAAYDFTPRAAAPIKPLAEPATSAATPAAKPAAKTAAKKKQETK